MRIIAGTLKGRILSRPNTQDTRPTPDRVREALFSMVSHHLDWQDLQVLDPFAGSGALGFEALSRGATHVTFFETNPLAFEALAHNARTLKLDTHTKLIKQDFLKSGSLLAQKKAKFDLVFLDPPYHQNLISSSLLLMDHQGLLNQNAVITLETHHTETLDLSPGFKIILSRVYGSVKIMIVTWDKSS